MKISRILTVASVLVCTVLGIHMFMARFYRLDVGLQYDELYSIATALPTLPFSVIWHDMLLRDVNLPLFNILFYGWNHFFPPTPFYGHLFSAILGALAVIAGGVLAPKSWPLLKRFFFVVLMSGSFILVAYGSNMRSYSLSVLLATSFTLLALRIIDHFEQATRPSVFLWLSFLGTGLLGAYSHYFCAAVFFIAALVVFLYACYYRRGRAWSFWGTALVFLLWIAWPIHVVALMKGGSLLAEGDMGSWWYQTPFLASSWTIIVFLLGYPKLVAGLLWVAVVAAVSLGFTYKSRIFRQADIMLPLAQVILLCAVLAVVSSWFNLWMDRYFLPVLPSILILLAGIFYHLQARHKIFILLVPTLLAFWFHLGIETVYSRPPEYMGMNNAFRYLEKNHITRVLLDSVHLTYPPRAVEEMLSYYQHPGQELELIPLNEENVSLAWNSEPKVPILIILCSRVYILDVMSRLRAEPDSRAVAFAGDTCLYTARYLKRNDSAEGAQGEDKK